LQEMLGRLLREKIIVNLKIIKRTIYKWQKSIK
jgi:hypothetical protein